MGARPAGSALRPGNARDDQGPLFLQAKEAQASVLEGFAGASDYRNCGERVVVGQRLMQAASDILLGWLHVTGFGAAGSPNGMPPSGY